MAHRGTSGGVALSGGLGLHALSLKYVVCVGLFSVVATVPCKRDLCIGVGAVMLSCLIFECMLATYRFKHCG